MEYKDIFDKNKDWVADKLKEDPHFFEQHFDSQTPKYLYIGCSDSRVPANEITGLELGDLFVHRNIANIVAHNDMNMMAILQYAVEVLKVEHVVVCGHYGCGGIQAAMQPHSFGLLDNWLRNIRDVYRFHKLELENIKETEQKMNRLAEINVEEQCMNVIKNASIQKSYLKYGRPLIHGWIYDMENGYLKDLDIHFDDMLEKVQETYNLENDIKEGK